MNAEGALQFVDTNVLVYAHDRSMGKRHDLAVALLQELWTSRLGCLSVQVLQEFYVTITRKPKHPLSVEDASDIIRQLATWRVYRPGPQDVLDAIALHDRHGISFWDAQILTSAARAGCEIVWSEDLGADRRYGEVTVRNPFSVPGEGIPPAALSR